MDRNNHPTCPDCGEVSRRNFIRVAGGAAIAAGAVRVFATPRPAQAAVRPAADAEAAVKRLYESLSGEQKKVICFDYGHQLRKKISANWAITKPAIESKFYTDEQRRTIDEIVRGITSADGYERVGKLCEDDWDGIGSYRIALFGTPGEGKSEFELTGRHLTMRANGSKDDKVAFGGGIVYGHSMGSPRTSLFYYQTQKANEVIKALDGKQRGKALLENPPRENAVKIQGKGGTFPGIAVRDLSDDQKKLVEESLTVGLAPYREQDIAEAMEILKAGGGLDSLSMAFYKKGDLGADEIWDIWRVEGPTFVWHFRGAPHVHAYINIGTKQA